MPPVPPMDDYDQDTSFLEQDDRRLQDIPCAGMDSGDRMKQRTANSAHIESMCANIGSLLLRKNSDTFKFAQAFISLVSSQAIRMLRHAGPSASLAFVSPRLST